MTSVVHIWLRAALVLAVLFGCHMAAPTQALASAPGHVLHMDGCYGSSKSSGGAAAGCHSHSVGLPAEADHIRHPALVPASFDLASLPALKGEAAGPNAPPPRSA